MKKLFIGDIVSRSWDLAVKHWPVFLILSLISGVISSFSGGDPTALSSLGQNPDPQEVFEAISNSFSPLMMIIVLFVTTYIGFITYRMLVNVMVWSHDIWIFKAIFSIIPF